ncbi:MAG: NADPH-dependent oxidoreductase [Armatimonadetes bacterium]|nr:NADPH-dependent oxidoreductase [Armatimonadota bacterium]
MSNAVLTLLERHRSIRRYKSDPIPRETIETIIAAGQRAATSSNMQYGTAVVVERADTRARLAELCGDQAFIREAPVFIAWCADRSRMERACKQRGYNQDSRFVEAMLVAAVDVALMMQNATVAAESLGLGCCYIGGIRDNPDAIIDLLELPKLVFPISGMTLGVPDHEPMLRPRLPLEAVLHWERYDASHERPLFEAYDETMAKTGIYGGRQVPAPGRPAVSEDYSWREHSARRVSQPRRTTLRETLRAQGFDLA